MTDARDKLQLFQSRELVAERFGDWHGRKISAEKADEIACSVTQGLQYFSASSSAAALIRPLLQYYGCVAISRALVLFCDPVAREATLKASHGLSIHGWQQQLAGGLQALPTLSVRSTHGTFTELVKATSNYNQFEVDLSPYPSRLLLRQTGRPVLQDASFSLGEVLARIPPLRRYFFECTRLQPANFQASIFVSDHRNVDGRVKASISLVDDEIGPVDVARAAKCLGVDASFFSTSGSIGNRPTRGYSLVADDWEALLADLPWGANHGGRDFLVLPFESGVKLGKLHLLFLAAYFLGMLVRYHAKSWAHLSTRVKGDRMLPLFDAAGAAIQRDFPDAVVELLMQESTFSGRGWA